VVAARLADADADSLEIVEPVKLVERAKGVALPLRIVLGVNDDLAILEIGDGQQPRLGEYSDRRAEARDRGYIR
jgi:hypothetical protein